MMTDQTVVSLSRQELIRLEMICVDSDKDQALAFLKDLRSKTNQAAQGMTSHLDAATS